MLTKKYSCFGSFRNGTICKVFKASADPNSQFHHETMSSSAYCAPVSMLSCWNQAVLAALPSVARRSEARSERTGRAGERER